jgi:hypothetical protein
LFYFKGFAHFFKKTHTLNRNERANLCKGLLKIIGNSKALKNLKEADCTRLQEAQTKEADENLAKILTSFKKE